MELYQLGTMTLKGDFPLSIDGFVFGEKNRTIRFKITNKGFIRGGKLYRTFDPEVIIKTFGVKNARYTLKYRDYIKEVI